MDEVTYEFAGTTIGAQNVYDCVTCGALVREEMQARHTRGHEPNHNGYVQHSLFETITDAT